MLPLLHSFGMFMMFTNNLFWKYIYSFFLISFSSSLVDLRLLGDALLVFILVDSCLEMIKSGVKVGRGLGNQFMVFPCSMRCCGTVSQSGVLFPFLLSFHHFLKKKKKIL